VVCHGVIGTTAANGHAAFADHLATGAGERARDTRRWYLDNADVLHRAVVRRAAPTPR
jgi:hypothetical protein